MAHETHGCPVEHTPNRCATCGHDDCDHIIVNAGTTKAPVLQVACIAGRCRAHPHEDDLLDLARIEQMRAGQFIAL